MRRTFAFFVALVCVSTILQPVDADARRIGGGRSFGAQRSITPAPAPSTPAPSATAPSGAASNPVMPAPSGATAARPATPATPAAATGGASRWLGPIAGIAAGLGLAALFSHLGLSETFGSLLLIVLGIAVVAFIVRALLARGGTSTASPRYAPQPATGTLQRVEPTVKPLEPAWGGATPTTATQRRFPPGFDPVPFVAEAKRQFTRLQAAYDRGDESMLAEVLTPQMLEEISRDIGQRGPHVPTEVVSLDAEVLDVATERDQHWASVRFKGQTREDGKPVPESFDEVWNLAKPVDGSSGWRLAGIQQYA
ncbi:MAG TPA: Tim44-like domain-containing protein [Casimicrobiaceae bacterium]|jgi:predicted lipid-binding transport protein (Tim44 family)